jgi:hypothetical protein
MKKFKLTGLILIVSFIIFNEAKAQVAKYQALYIYNICRLVEWPDDFNGNNFVIALVGKNAELESVLKGMASTKTVYGKPLLIKYINSPTEAKDCHLVFFSKGSEKLMENFSKESNSLFVSETSDGLLKGSDINFVLKNNKLLFELHKTKMSGKSFFVSSELKNLATSVL